MWIKSKKKKKAYETPKFIEICVIQIPSITNKCNINTSCGTSTSLTRLTPVLRKRKPIKTKSNI